MKLLYSLLVVALICQISNGESVVKQAENIPCMYCNQVVSTLQRMLNTTTDYNTIIQNVENNICDAISQFVPEDRCVAFVKVYGSYLLRVISSSSNLTPNKICVDILQFCPNSAEDQDKPSFVPLLPSISSSNQITWSATETGYSNGAAFYYKVLIPEDDITSQDNLAFAALTVSLDNVEASCVSLRIFQPDTYTDTKTCKDSYTSPTEISSVQKGSWYYFIVTASDLTESQYNTQFTLSITEYNAIVIGGDEPHPATGYTESHVHLTGIFLPLLLTLTVALCCCCCCSRSKRQEHIKKQQQKRQLEEQSLVDEQQQHSFVDLQVFPATFDHQQPPVGGYLYYPLPPNVIPYPYVPVSAPPATNENLNN
jgi:hypothetical protein